LTSISFINIYAQNGPIKIGQKAPSFKLKILNKDRFIKLDSISENRIVVIEFWATWCGPCIQAFPHIDSLKQKFSNAGVDFLSITYETNENKLNKFLAIHPLNTLVCIDQDLKMFKDYQAWAIPQTLIIDKKRNLVVSLYPTKVTEQIIRDVLDNKPLDIPGNGHQTYFDPKGAEAYFRKVEKESKE
jgi:thiol-disulfide isomerase/thioredoxin